MEIEEGCWLGWVNSLLSPFVSFHFVQKRDKKLFTKPKKNIKDKKQPSSSSPNNISLNHLHKMNHPHIEQNHTVFVIDSRIANNIEKQLNTRTHVG